MSWLQMQIHQVERNSRLQISLDPVDRDLLSDIQDPAEADPWLGNGLVHLLIRLNALLEIRNSFLLTHSRIVRITRASFESHVGSDDDGVVAE